MHMEERSPDYGIFQEIVDAVFKSSIRASKHTRLLQAEIRDPSQDVLDVINGLPSGNYLRPTLVDQLNSAIAARGWGSYLGTVE